VRGKDGEGKADVVEKAKHDGGATGCELWCLMGGNLLTKKKRISGR